MIGGIYTMYIIECYDDVSVVQVFQLQSAIADLLISLIEETTMDGINVAKVTNRLSQMTPFAFYFIINIVQHKRWMIGCHKYEGGFLNFRG